MNKNTHCPLRFIAIVKFLGESQQWKQAQSAETKYWQFMNEIFFYTSIRAVFKVEGWFTLSMNQGVPFLSPSSYDSVLSYR